jgi:hypothetical protein
MGTQNILGLLLEINADPSKAQEAIDRFEKSSGDSLKRAAAGTKPLDNALLSNVQSVRLLGQEFGIGLPRAVSSAIAKMLPEIAGLGTGLLGIFAVEKAYEWGKVVNEQFFQIYTHGDQTIKDLDVAATAAFKHAGQEASEMLTHFKTSLAGAFDIAQINAHAAQLERFHDAYKSLVGKMGTELTEAIAKVAPTITEANAQGLYKLEDVDKKIAELGQLQFEAHRHMAEVQTKEDNEAGKVAKRAADAAYQAAMKRYEANQRAFHASEEALKREMALQDRVGREAVEAARRMEEAKEREAKAIERLTEQLRREHAEEARNAEELGREAARQITDIERVGNEQERSMLRGRAEARQRIEEQHNDAVKAIQDAEAQAQAIARLTSDYKAMGNAAVAAYTAMSQANANYLKQLHEQQQAEEQAHQADLERAEAKMQTSASEIATFVGAIAGRKAEAEVEGGFYLAEGTFDFFRGMFPPNPALITRGLGEIGAGIDMLKVAGKSGHPATAGGGIGGGGEYGGERYGGRAERYEGGGGGESERDLSGPGLAPGAQGSPSGRVNVTLIGESETCRWLAGVIQNAHASGYHIPATVADRSAPAQG